MRLSQLLLFAFVCTSVGTVLVSEGAMRRDCSWGDIMRLSTFSNEFTVDSTSIVSVKITLLLSVLPHLASCKVMSFKKSIGLTSQTVSSVQAQGSFSGAAGLVNFTQYTSDSYRFVRLQLPRAVAVGETFTAEIRYKLNTPLSKVCDDQSAIQFEETWTHKWSSPNIVQDFKYSFCDSRNKVLSIKSSSFGQSTKSSGCYEWNHKWIAPTTGLGVVFSVGASTASQYSAALPEPACSQDSSTSLWVVWVVIIVGVIVVVACAAYLMMFHPACSSTPQAEQFQQPMQAQPLAVPIAQVVQAAPVAGPPPMPGLPTGYPPQGPPTGYPGAPSAPPIKT